MRSASILLAFRRRRGAVTSPSRKCQAAALALVFAAAPSLAGAAANCWTIEDPDQRAYCRAVATNSVGQCSAISDFSLRQTCRARLQANPSSCNSLTGEWKRQECRRQAGR